MKRNTVRTFIIAVPIILLSIGLKLAQGEGRLLYISSEGPAYMKASFYRFGDTKERKVGMNPGDSLLIDWREEEKSGSLSLEIRDPSGVVIETLASPASGYLLTARGKGNHRLKVIGEKARGSFAVSWEYLPAAGGSASP